MKDNDTNNHAHINWQLFRCTLSTANNSYEHPKSKLHGASYHFFSSDYSSSDQFKYYIENSIKNSLCYSKFILLLFFEYNFDIRLLHQVCTFPSRHVELHEMLQKDVSCMHAIQTVTYVHVLQYNACMIDLCSFAELHKSIMQL